MFYYQEFNLKLKQELEHQYDAWQVIVDSKVAGLYSWFKLREILETSKESLEKKIQKARSNLVLEKNLPEKSLGPLREELD